ncbi:helix-turn-helix domain-containing protein [Streptomyces iranensis]|uniref:helix-turn-helix domain-containing protein n=1 Tax=Streptomyces iranensis TaxID=576784 RepID=UPI0039B733A9
MARWKELPDSLDHRARQLVVQLRRLKDRSGLSLASLEAKTGYSRSSWERYLNGKALPPRQAVQELARVTGAEPTRLLVLYEVAEEAWRQRVAPSSSAGAKDSGGQGVRNKAAAERSDAAEDSGTAEKPGAWRERPAAAAAPPPGERRPFALATVVAAALVGVGAGMLIAAPWGDDDGGGGKAKTTVGTTSAQPGSNTATATATATATEGPGQYIFKLGKSYPCKVRRTGPAGGELGAGYSTTRTAVLAGPGWDVVEAQCLLHYHKMDPGTADGIYGQQTIAAVARLQKKAGLPADGIVGPHTWRVLRG